MTLESLILEHFPNHSGAHLSEGNRKKVLAFYELLLEENKLQNLTRITSAEDFFYSNLIDVLELFATGWLSYPVLDIGSGGGVPGLLAALIDQRAEAENLPPCDEKAWILTESEGKKADFLKRAVLHLGLEASVEVFAGRAEDYLKGSQAETLVARAVGPVDRIYGWVRKAQGWKTLVLLKGPAWDEEWGRFQETQFAQELKLEKIHDYIVGPEQKKRRIILLRRVPRGTLKI